MNTFDSQFMPNLFKSTVHIPNTVPKAEEGRHAVVSNVVTAF